MSTGSNIYLTRKMLQNQHAAFISDVARLANELQRDYPDMTRTHALNEAERLIGKYGLGVSLVPRQ